MICQDCQKAYQTVKSPLKEIASCEAIVIGVIASVFGMLVAFAFSADSAICIATAAALNIVGIATAIVGCVAMAQLKKPLDVTLREAVRRNLIGWPVFAYTEHGEVHEHLTRPMGIAYIQLRIGGIFRRCHVVDWEGNVLPWAVECWNGLFQPVTIRNRVTDETFSSIAPAQLIAKALIPGVEIVTPRHTLADIVGYERVRHLFKERVLKQTPAAA